MTLITAISTGIPGQLNLPLTLERIDGFIIDSLKKELSESNFYNRYNESTIENGDLYPMSGRIDADNAISKPLKELRNL